MTDTNNTDGAALLPVTQADRDAAADAVKSYRDQKNGNWQQRIRDGLCDDGEMVQSFTRHRLSHSIPAHVIAALEPFACDDFETPITDEQGWTEFGLSWSKDRIRDWFGPSAFRRAREMYRAALTPSPCPGDGMREEAAEARRVEAIALNQNDEMRQQLSHVGNMISDLARAMGVDQADADGGWPDLAGRIQKLIDAALTPSPCPGDAGEVETTVAAIVAHLRTRADGFRAAAKKQGKRVGPMAKGFDWAALEIESTFAALPSHKGAGE